MAEQRGTPLANQDLRARLAETFTEKELPGLFKAGSTFPPEMRAQWLEDQITQRQAAQQKELNSLRAEPSFQAAVASEQLGAPVDMADEATSFLDAVAQRASPIVGGRGGSVDIQGEFLDVKAQNPGSDVQIISVPGQNGLEPVVMVEQKDGSYKPANRPSFSAADAGAMVGDLFTLEGVGSLAAYMGGPGGRLLGRALKAAFGAGLGASGDELLNTAVSDEETATLMSRLATRGSFGALSAFGGEFLAAGLGHGAELLFRGATVPGSEGEKQALARARSIMEQGAPVHAGQVSPNSWIARMRSRWVQLDPALREQTLNQLRWLGQDQKKVAQQYLSQDGVDQAISMAGMDLTTLDKVEREIAADLAGKAQQDLGLLGQPRMSRSRAGEEVKEAIFSVKPRDVASYRQLGNALLSELDNKILDAAETGSFTFNTGGLKREAKNALDYFNAFEERAGSAALNLETGEDMLNVGVRQVRQKYSADMKFVLNLLADLPDDGLPSNGVFQVRTTPQGSMEGSPFVVDGNGTIRTSYQKMQGAEADPAEGALGGGVLNEKPQPDVTGQSPVGTYELNGVQLLRTARSKLREYFSNPLMPIKDSEAQLAKKLYLQIGEVMENTEGSPAFASAVRRYNKASSRFLGTMDTLRTAGFAKEGDGKSVVTNLTSGEVGFDTLFTLKNTLRRSGERGGSAWNSLRNSALRDMLNNPEKVKNLDIDPETTRLWLDDGEQQVLRDYATQREIMQRQGPRSIGARASGTRGRALALFSTVPDNATFSRLWSHMSDQDRNIMRYSVLEDVLNKATGPAFQETGVLNPASYAKRVEGLLAGDSGDRLRILFRDQPETIEQLKRGADIAAFYSKAMNLDDMGASIFGSELAGAVQNQAMQGDAKGVIKAALSVRLNNMLAASLAEGVLGKVFSPRVAEPSNVIGHLQAMTSMGIATLNANTQAADPAFEARLAEAAKKAQQDVLKRRQNKGR